MAARRLTAAQAALLRSAAASRDGSVLVAGFNRSQHSPASAKGLELAGLIAGIGRPSFRGTVYRITAAGRQALEALSA